MNNKKNVLVTGNGSGLGLGLTEAYLDKGWHVYGCSRRGCRLKGALADIRCDLSDPDALNMALETLLAECEQLDLVILNAGMLGEIKSMKNTSIDELEEIMAINVWANKVILDWLIEWGKPVTQIVMISSGAAVLGNKGWGGYALSKAALNMLCRLYAHEFPGTHLSAVAPGLINTAMMDYLCKEVDADEYPALKRLQNSRGTEQMQEPQEAALRLISVLDEIRDYPSGSFIDIRAILEPEEYARLMANNHGKSEKAGES